MNKHSVLLYGHRTSITLEPEFWQALSDIADKKGQSIASIVAEVDKNRQTNLSSSLRVFILKTLQEINQQNNSQ